MRWCPACMRPKEEHRVERTVAHGPLGATIERRRVCDVRLVADRTAIDMETGERVPTGERYIPDTVQRTRRNRTRWVHSSRLKAGVA
jgi:hypothetical protein